MRRPALVVVRSAVGAAILSLLTACADPASPPPAPAERLRAAERPSLATNPYRTFGGHATVVRASLLGLAPVSLVEAGPLPQEGGNLRSELVSANLPGLVTASLLKATTRGSLDAANSEAFVAQLLLTAGGNVVRATEVGSAAQAWSSMRCYLNGATGIRLSGMSTISNLVVNGTTVAVTSAPNQTIQLPNGTLVLNEQVASRTVTAGSITVNALHLTVRGLTGVVADVVISSARADVTCTP